MVAEADGTGSRWTRGERRVQVVKGQPLRMMFWAGLGHRRSSPLVRVGRLNSATYVETLRRRLLPMRSPGLVFQQVASHHFPLCVVLSGMALRVVKRPCCRTTHGLISLEEPQPSYVPTASTSWSGRQ